MKHPGLPHPGDWHFTGIEGAHPDAGPHEDRSLTSISEMFGVLRRYGRSLSVWVLFCVLLGAAYIYTTPPEYLASTLVILEPHRQPVTGADTGAPTYPLTLDSAQAESQIQVVKSERILSFVFDLLDLATAPEFAKHPPSLRERLQSGISLLLARFKQPSAEPAPAAPSSERARAFQAFADRISVRRIGQSYVLEISYRADSPAQAARLANSITAAYIRDQIDQKAAAAQRGTEFQGRIADLKAEQQAALDGVRLGVIPPVQLPDSDARVISAALEPLSKAYPQSTIVMAFALCFGLLAGVMAVAIRHSFDRTIKSRQQLWRALGIECLSVIPNAAQARDTKRLTQGAGLGRAIISHPDSEFAQAVRATRTAILLSSPAERHRSFGIVSWSRGEGKSTMASNLARLIAASGEAVVLIDGDLRHPALSTSLSPSAATGLSEALLRHNGVADLEMVGLSETLSFIPAVGNGHASEPNVYLGAPEMQFLIATLRAEHDVIIDFPALNLSSDAQALSPFLDGIVLIVEADRTTIDEVAGAIRALQTANARILGVVLNKAKGGR